MWRAIKYIISVMSNVLFCQKQKELKVPNMHSPSNDILGDYKQSHVMIKLRIIRKLVPLCLSYNSKPKRIFITMDSVGIGFICPYYLFSIRACQLISEYHRQVGQLWLYSYKQHVISLMYRDPSWCTQWYQIWSDGFGT